MRHHPAVEEMMGNGEWGMGNTSRMDIRRSEDTPQQHRILLICLPHPHQPTTEHPTTVDHHTTPLVAIVAVLAVTAVRLVVVLYHHVDLSGVRTGTSMSCSCSLSLSHILHFFRQTDKK